MSRVNKLLVILLLCGSSQLWAEETPKSNFYLKGIGGAGAGIEEVSLLMWTTEREEVKVRTGGGFNIEGALGYLLNSTSRIEVGLGYQKVGENPQLKDGEGYFKKIALTATYIYQFPSQSLYHFYLGAGVGYYLSPELYREGLDIETTCKYDPSFGFHGLGGVEYKYRKKISFFGEFKYVGGVKYELKEATENGTELTSGTKGWETWKELDGNQWFLNGGVIYYF